MVLDPDTFEAFELPIGSLRYALTGQDMASDTCVSLIWFYGGFQEPFQQKCANNMVDWPYVIVTPNATAPCMQWDYAGNVTVDSAVGCVQFMQTNPVTGEIEMTVDVSGGSFTGTIIADNIP